jgi:pimeloyl-ACP methyl ester carboxylesterase
MAVKQTRLIAIEYRSTTIDLSVNMRNASDDLVLFLHGFGCAKETFDQAFEIPELRNFSLCSFDFPGHGQSDRLQPSLYSLETYAEIANSLVDRIDHKRVFIVGHSMGGAVAVIAAQGRQDIACLVSVDGNLVSQDCGIVSRSTAAQSAEEFARSGYSDFAARLKGSPRQDEVAWANWYAEAEPSALHASARSLVEWSDSGKLLDLFGEIDCGAYIYGDQEQKSYLLPLLYKSAGHASVYRIPHAGHFVMIDDPFQFYSVLTRTLNDAKLSSYARRRYGTSAITI